MKTDSAWVSTIELDSSNVQTHLGFDPEEPARVALAEDRTPTPDELPLTAYLGTRTQQLAICRSFLMVLARMRCLARLPKFS